MRLLLTADRLRNIAATAATERELENVLRRHKIRFCWTTAPGFLAARVPCRSGSVLIYRAAGRSGCMVTRSAPAVAPACYPLPLPRFTWDD